MKTGRNFSRHATSGAPALDREAPLLLTVWGVGTVGLGAAPALARVPVGMVDAPVAEPELEQKEALDVPWNVVVHNDPVNLMSYVVKVFMKVFGFSQDRARKHMLEVHEKGRSIVWTGERERCEFYVQQLHGHLLLATLEKSS